MFPLFLVNWSIVMNHVILAICFYFIIASILDSVRTPKTPHGSVSYKREYKKLRDDTANDLFNLFNKTVFDDQVCQLLIF